MRTVTHSLITGLLALLMALAVQGSAEAQYPVAIEAVVPAAVGYSTVRRGLLGRRVVVRQVVAPVAAAVPLAAAVPVQPVVTVARPVIAAPMTIRYAPPIAPVAAYYYGRPAPVVRVRTYRAPVAYGYGF